MSDGDRRCPRQRPMLPFEVVAVRADGAAGRRPRAPTRWRSRRRSRSGCRAARPSRCAPRERTASWRSASCSPRGSFARRRRWRPWPSRSDDVVEVELTESRPGARRRAWTAASPSPRPAVPAASRPRADALRLDPPFAPPPPALPRLTPALIASLPDRLRAAQPTFARTGGLHAAGLFDAGGDAAGGARGRRPAQRRRQGGRGAPARRARCPPGATVLVVSGRASFELVQKAVLAGIPALAAVGAPSTLAVELASAHGLTLLGFVRDGRFNIYTHADRVDLRRAPMARPRPRGVRDRTQPPDDSADVRTGDAAGAAGGLGAITATPGPRAVRARAWCAGCGRWRR